MQSRVHLNDLLQTWQSDLVYFLDSAGELVSVPAAWTDLVAPDPFVVVAAGTGGVSRRGPG